MINAVIKGAIIGGLIAFIWGWVSWMYIPAQMKQPSSFRNEAFVASVIKENALKAGIYTIPSMEGHKDQAQVNAAMKKGPIVFAAVSPQGVGSFGFTYIIISVITQAVIGALMGLLLYLSNIKHYVSKVILVTLIAVTGGVIYLVPAWNFWHFSLGYIGFVWLDSVIGWFLAGLVLAFTIKGGQCCKGEHHHHHMHDDYPS